jgi:hypothetical protein
MASAPAEGVDATEFDAVVDADRMVGDPHRDLAAVAAS